jgi:hypothetical protein
MFRALGGSDLLSLRGRRRRMVRRMVTEQMRIKMRMRTRERMRTRTRVLLEGE